MHGAPGFGFDPDLDVWVSAQRVAVSGPVGEMLLTGRSTAEIALRLGAEGPVTEAALLDGPEGMRGLAALNRLRRLRLVVPATPDATPFPPWQNVETPRRVLLEGDPATALEAAARRIGGDTAWLPLRLGGPMPWAGPLFGLAGDGPCLACLVLRLRGATEVARAALGDPTAIRVQTAAPRPRPDRIAALLARLDAMLATDPAALRTTILACDKAGITARPVVRGACGCAGDPALAALPLAALVARLRDGLIGPVPLLREIGAPDDPMRIATASQSPVARWAGLPPPNLADLAIAARALSLSSGTGPTPAAARLGAAMEAIENYAALWRGPGDGVVREASFAELPPGTALSYQALLGFAASQGAEGDASVRRAWCRAEELDASGAAIGSVLLPLALAYDGAPAPGAEWWESNGLGAGLTGDAARAHALAELVERDAVAIWWHNALPRPLLPLDETDATMGAAIASHRRRGRSIALLDITHDLGVPARAALAWDPLTGGAITAGFAADSDPARADRRALAESCLRLPALDQWRRGGGRGRLPEWFAQGNLADLPWLLAGPYGAAQNPAPMDAASRLAAVLRALVGAGLRPLIVDLLRPDTGIPVVKAFVPGLRHTRNRFGPGRLYDVPVALGWLAAPRTETAMLAFPEGLW